MNDIHLLSILTFLPLVFAAVVLMLPNSNGKTIQWTALLGTIATLVVSVLVYTQHHAGGEQFQLQEHLAWLPSAGINYFIGIDGISLLMVLMTTAIFPFAVGVSFSGITTRVKQFYFWMLVMETAVLGVFLSLNLVMFYIFWEAMLVPMYFIIGIWGGSNRIYATVKFFIYTMIGSMVMLVSIMAVYFISPVHTFDFPTLVQTLPVALAKLPRTTEMLLFIGFFLAFGIKAPVWPFHTWVPDAYSEAPTGGTIVLVALKMGLYGFIRFCLPLFPNAVHDAAPVIIVLSVIGVVYAALVAAMQTDLKKLIAYSSVSHIGVIMLAIFTTTSIGINGAVLQMVSHTFTTGALFILVGGLKSRRGSTLISDFGGLMKPMPAFTAIFLIVTLSSVALPLTSGFSGEILMLIGSFQTHPIATGIATTSAIWGVVYMLWMFQRVMYGPVGNADIARYRDATPGEFWALAPIVALIFFLGVYPKPALIQSDRSVSDVLSAYKSGQVDPYTTASLPATKFLATVPVQSKGAH